MNVEAGDTVTAGQVLATIDSAELAAAVTSGNDALTTRGTRHTVTVLDGSSTKVVAVEVGVVGATWTEITSGVRAGRSVAFPGGARLQFGGPPGS